MCVNAPMYLEVSPSCYELFFPHADSCTARWQDIRCGERAEKLEDFKVGRQMLPLDLCMSMDNSRMHVHG